MAIGVRIPPGRAGRMWLRRRIDTAARGRDQLDRKLRILLPEQQRLRIQADRTRTVWEAAYEEADRWLLRAALLGGQDALRHAAAPDLLDVQIIETTAMGLRYPTDVVSSAPQQEFPAPPDNAAIVPTAAAFRRAVEAAARAAAAAEAQRRLDAEVLVTRRRLRALDKRWLPWLQESLRGLELALEQSEQDEGIRLRRGVAVTDGRPGR